MSEKFKRSELDSINDTKKKDSGINRVVGFGSEKEDDLLQYFKKIFENKIPELNEKEKTTEEKQIIERVNSSMYDFLSQYGIDPIKVPLKNIHILDKTKITKEEFDKIKEKFGTENGFYAASTQSIIILKDYYSNKLSFTNTLVHEILHLQGFYSYQKSKKEAADVILEKEDDLANMNIRRSGFSIGTTDGKRLLFHNLNESVITELQIRFEKKYMKRWSEFEEDIRKRDIYIEEVSKRDNVPIELLEKTIAGVKGDESSGYKFFSYPYHNERRKLDSLIDELYEKNTNDFNSKEEVFQLFAKATMTGRIMTVARLIEKTFGKGSFRFVGEQSSDKKNI